MSRAASQTSREAPNQLHFASIEPVRLGMPELCRAGLSESWLWKACGHRHWLALASAHGLAKPDFRAVEGDRLYPAFTSVRLENGHLDCVREDDTLDFAVTLTRVGRTRFSSRIAVRCGDLVVAIVILDSAFVRRTVCGRNHSASRAQVARPCSLLPPAQNVLPRNKIDSRSDQPAIATYLFEPTPYEDFNGADFLYFAAFQAMIDRAEWHWLPRTGAMLSTESREILYLGNIELGEQVRIVLRDLDQRCGQVHHRVEFYRSSDDAMIAYAVSDKRSGAEARS